MLGIREHGALLRLASRLPKGSEERRTILAGLHQDATRLEGKLASNANRLPPDKKDYDRLNDLTIKATYKATGEINKAKVIQYARAMASSIDDWAKAERRGSAALIVRQPEAAEIFFARADELKGGTNPALPALPAAKVPRVKAPVEPPEPSPTLDAAGGREKIHVIPLGSVDLRNGDNRTFNVLDTWGGEPHHNTVCERDSAMGPADNRGPRRVIVMGYGDSGWRPGQLLEMWGDQTMKFMGTLLVVKSIEGTMDQDMLDRTRRALGSNSALAYVLK